MVGASVGIPHDAAQVQGRGVRNVGILVRDPVALETAATVERIVLDKTGTLAQGELSVTATAVPEGSDRSADELQCLAVAGRQFAALAPVKW